jgi:hypothetical protein
MNDEPMPCQDCDRPTTDGWIESFDDRAEIRVYMCDDCQQLREDWSDEVSADSNY